MPYQVGEVAPKPLLALRVADADTGEPRRMTVHTGEAIVITKSTGVRVITGLLPREPCALFVPDARPLEPHDQAVVAQVEAYLCGVVINGNAQKLAGYGVADATATFVADPRGGPLRWLQLSFTATTLEALRMGYRITVLSPV